MMATTLISSTKITGTGVGATDFTFQISGRTPTYGEVLTTTLAGGASVTTDGIAISTFDGFEVGFHSTNPISIVHQIKITPDGEWLNDGTDASITSLTSKFKHKGYQYRAIITDDGAGSDVQVWYLGN